LLSECHSIGMRVMILSKLASENDSIRESHGSNASQPATLR